eukprot:COSAG02_NODE_9060_length_2345_cov_13.474622_2_plen_141_part_00
MICAGHRRELAEAEAAEREALNEGEEAREAQAGLRRLRKRRRRQRRRGSLSRKSSWKPRKRPSLRQERAEADEALEKKIKEEQDVRINQFNVQLSSSRCASSAATFASAISLSSLACAFAISWSSPVAIACMSAAWASIR